MRPYALQSINTLSIVLVIMSPCHESAIGQCSGIVSSPSEASSCASYGISDVKVTTIDSHHQYSLGVLIDIGERNNPKARVAWERAKQSANQLGIERSEYYPLLAGIALFSDRRQVQPSPKPLAPLGYTISDLPLVEPRSHCNICCLTSAEERRVSTRQRRNPSHRARSLLR